MVSVKHTGPEVGLPSKAPSGGLVSALDKGYPCGVEQFRRAWIDLVGRIESVEMGNVPVLVLGIVHILDPLLELSVLAHLHRRKFGHCLGEGLLVCIVNSKFCGCRLGGCHNIHYDLSIHCTAGSERVGLSNSTVLRAYRRNNYKVTVVGVNLHIIQVEVCSSLDHRIPFLEEILVLCKEIVLP